MGHEFTGIIVDAGKDVKSVKIGDKVVAPFTVSCLDCFYCKMGHTSRCTRSTLFGSEALDGMYYHVSCYLEVLMLNFPP